MDDFEGRVLMLVAQESGVPQEDVSKTPEPPGWWRPRPGAFSAGLRVAADHLASNGFMTLPHDLRHLADLLDGVVPKGAVITDDELRVAVETIREGWGV